MLDDVIRSFNGDEQPLTADLITSGTCVITFPRKCYSDDSRQPNCPTRRSAASSNKCCGSMSVAMAANIARSYVTAKSSRLSLWSGH